jgi:hypothetical protein
MLKRILIPATILAALTTLAVPYAASAADHPGSCGVYKYWHDGHCVDARNAPAKSWTDTMASKLTW